MQNTTIHRDGGKVWLEGVYGWSPSEKVSSVHAAFEAIMNSLGEEICYENLVGVSGLAFRMQVGGLCPSSPHPCCGYKCVERSIRMLPWKSHVYAVTQDKKKKLKNVNDEIVHSINRGIPIQTGEEDDGLIIGYNQEKKELICLHPWHDSGKKSFVVSSLADICWSVTIYTDRKTKKEDFNRLVTESLTQAVKMAKTSKVQNYYVGFKAWEKYIQALQEIDEKEQKVKNEDVMGNAWIYESLVQCRDIAARYLFQIKDEFNESAGKHLKNAGNLYDRISEEILAGDQSANEIAPYPESLIEGVEWIREKRQNQITRLKKALLLEVQAIDEIEKALTFIRV